MGSISRYSRCDRFMKEFNADYQKRWNIVGDFVVSQGLDMHDECVYYFALIRDASGNEVMVMIPDQLFDPENGCAEDLTLVMSEALYDADEREDGREVLKQRLKQADLISDGDESDDGPRRDPGREDFHSDG